MNERTSVLINKRTSVIKDTNEECVDIIRANVLIKNTNERMRVLIKDTSLVLPFVTYIINGRNKKTQ